MSARAFRPNPLQATLVALPLLMLSCGSGSKPTAANAGRSGEAPRLEHVIVVVMENHSYDDVRTQPYVSRLIASSAAFSNFRAVTHPSQPNYLVLWSGGTQGVTNDDCPPPASPFTTPNLGQAVEAAGLTWRSYSEDLPAAGSAECKAGLYVRRHCPWTNWSNLNHGNERPFTALSEDIAAGRLPNLAFVIPNNCHNTHDGGSGCGVADGDAWLAANLPGMISAVGPSGLVVLTWDEDDGDQSNRILTVFAGRPVRAGVVSDRALTHYTLHRTLCEVLGLPPHGQSARETPITDVWAAGAAR